jgi:mRNA interferase MazF
MTRFRAGDILVTAFPFADSKKIKRRPVLCMATLSPKKGISLCWVAMITSTELKGWDGDIEIKNYKKVGLPVPSMVRTAKIACIDHSIIQKKVGSLDDALLGTVFDTVRNTLKLT